MYSQKSFIFKIVSTLLILIALMIGGLVFSEFSTKVKMTTWGVISPVINSISAPTTAVGRFLSTWKDVQNLRTLVEDLQNQNTDLQAQVAILISYQHQVEQLREQLKLTAQIPIEDYHRVAAEVIELSSGQKQKWIVINRGSDDGIKVDDVVVSGTRLLIGKVANVDMHVARVQLMTNTKFVIRAATAENGTTGIVRGVANLGMRLTFVDRTQPLADGNQIITTTSVKVPAGLVIGVVRDIAPSNDGLFHEAVIAPLLDLRNLKIVYVLKSE